MGIQLGGFSGFSDDLASAAERLSASEGAGFVRNIVDQAAEPIYQKAKENAETMRKSGILAGSVKKYNVVHHKNGNGFSVKIGVKRGERGAAYANPLEYGHGGPHGPAAPAPFLRPAYDENKDAVYDRMRREIFDELRFRGL